VIITVVAVNRARRARIDSDADEGAWRWIPALVTTFPGWIALLMAVDLVAAVAVLVGDVSGPLVILGVPFGAVFAVEAIALILFTVFWLYETRRKWNEADPD
jgi:L-lactate permease